jgi:hypothetical protein
VLDLRVVKDRDGATLDVGDVKVVVETMLLAG